MSPKLKIKIYKTVLRPVLLYGSETWAHKKDEERLLEKTEMRMLRRIPKISLSERLRNEEIRAKAGVIDIAE